MAREKVEKGLEAAKRLERHLEEITKKVVTKETMTHFINAGTEALQAANAAMKQMNVPEETKTRIHKAEKEMLLAVRSAIDVVLSELDKEMPQKKSELRKIEIKHAAKPKRKSK
ncbi:MAG: hypothetical protein JW880_02820 [Candidatus Thermoplasmatota archaeon]|nr:hypothetical protein [Candidatus Thermoplasmatota archaeon]